MARSKMIPIIVLDADLEVEVVAGDAGLSILSTPGEGDGGGVDAAGDLQPHLRRGGVASDGEGRWYR